MKGAKKQTKWTQYRSPFDTDGEEADNVSIRQARLKQREHICAKMGTGQSWENVEIFVMDEDGEIWLKRWYIRKILAGSTKFRKVRSSLKSETQKQLLAGELDNVNPIPCGGAYMPPPPPHFGNFLQTYLSEEAPTIL